MKPRYTVHAISSGEPGIHACGQFLRGFSQRPAAKRFAERVANDYRYGAAIVDTQSATIDWGDEITDYEGRPTA